MCQGNKVNGDLQRLWQLVNREEGSTQECHRQYDHTGEGGHVLIRSGKQGSHDAHEGEGEAGKQQG